MGLDDMQSRASKNIFSNEQQRNYIIAADSMISARFVLRILMDYIISQFSAETRMTARLMIRRIIEDLLIERHEEDDQTEQLTLQARRSLRGRIIRLLQDPQGMLINDEQRSTERQHVLYGIEQLVEQPPRHLNEERRRRHDRQNFITQCLRQFLNSSPQSGNRSETHYFTGHGAYDRIYSDSEIDEIASLRIIVEELVRDIRNDNPESIFAYLRWMAYIVVRHSVLMNPKNPQKKR